MITGPVLSQSQRSFVRADTLIDQQIIDRTVRAFELLVDHDDVDGYKVEMVSVRMMVGDDAPEPTAMQVMMTICMAAYADRWHCSRAQARRRLQEMLNP